MPGIGYVDVPEDEDARLYDKLSSPDPDQIDAALATLRKIKAVEDEAVEAAQRRPPDDLLPPPERDLSEPISFGSRFSARLSVRSSGPILSSGGSGSRPLKLCQSCSSSR